MSTSTINKITILRSILLIFGCILFLDGFILILANKIHLGTLLPFLIGGFFILYSIAYNFIQSFLKQHQCLQKIWKLGWIVFIIWAISLVFFFLYIALNTNQKNYTEQVDTIIVLGSGIQKGQASPALALRLDTAAKIAQHFPQSKIIVSGGLDYQEIHTEAEVMSAYLQQHYQISPKRIYLENQSTSTQLNLQNSQAILFKQGLNLNSPITIVTSDFHTLRAAAIARKQGYSNFTMQAAETPVTTRYNAWLREYFAYLSGYVLNEY